MLTSSAAASRKTLITLLLSLNILSLAACNLPTPKQKTNSAEASDQGDNSEAATFSVEAMPNRSYVLEATKEKAFGLPTAKVFNFYACTKDVYYNKIISGHKFKIDEINKEVITDSSGCLVWSENIEYNYLADSRYIKIDRHIRGVGLHKGVRSVSYAINPWSHGENLAAVVDIKNENAVPNLVSNSKESGLALKGLSLDNQLRTRPLWMEEGRLFVTEQKLTPTGVDLLVEMRATPTIQLSKMNGDIWQKQLTSGSFNVRMKLIHSYIEDGKEIHRLLGQTGVVSAKMENDSLAVKAPISLPAIPKRGQLVLGVELRPIDAPPGLSSFDGIYILGDYDQIKGSSFLRLATQVAQDKDFKLDIYVNAQLPANLTNEGANPIDLDVYQKPKVEVLALDIEFRRADNEKTSTRDRIFNIKACLKNGIDQKSIGGHSFKVTHLRQSETETASLVEPQPKTDNNACLNWEEKITIKPYDCEHYIKGSIKIENSDLGMSETLSVLIDPWEKNGVGYDERYMSSAQNLRMDCQKEGRPSPRIGMNSFSYTTDHFRPSAVDNLLNLTMQKTIKLQLDPYVLNYSAFNAARDGGGPKLRDGIYLLNMVLVNNNDRENTNTYVASTKKLVAVANGSIATDLTFETQNLKSFGNRNNILIKIDPVDESKIQLKDNQLVVKQAGASLDSVIDHNSGLESYPFVGNIILTLGSDSPRLTPLNPKNIADVLLTNKEHRDQDPNLLDKITSEGLAAQNKHIQTLQAVANNPSFAKANNLSLVSLNNFESSTELTKALQIPSNLPDYALRKNELQNIINNRTLNKEIAKKLCVFWAREFWPQMYKEKGGAVMDLISTGFANDCFYAVEKDPSVFFQLERRLNVKEVSSELPSYGSRNFGLGVGTNFSLSQSNNFNFSRGVAFKAGLSKKFLDLFSIAAEGSMGFTWSDTTSSANAISANTQTTLNVYRYTVKAIANKYEPCAVVKINPSLFFPKGSWFSRFLKKDYLKIFNSRLNEQEQGLAATRGLMICEGQVHNQPVSLDENYYIITQDPLATGQDTADENNRNFFIALRSNNDFESFVLAIKGIVHQPETAKKEENHQTEVTDLMESLFKMNGPSYPGMYLVN